MPRPVHTERGNADFFIILFLFTFIRICNSKTTNPHICRLLLFMLEWICGIYLIFLTVGRELLTKSSLWCRSDRLTVGLFHVISLSHRDGPRQNLLVLFQSQLFLSRISSNPLVTCSLCVFTTVVFLHEGSSCSAFSTSRHRVVMPS